MVLGKGVENCRNNIGLRKAKTYHVWIHNANFSLLIFIEGQDSYCVWMYFWWKDKLAFERDGVYYILNREEIFVYNTLTFDQMSKCPCDCLGCHL
jgi:hypothetical protein